MLRLVVRVCLGILCTDINRGLKLRQYNMSSKDSTRADSNNGNKQHTMLVCCLPGGLVLTAVGNHTEFVSPTSKVVVHHTHKRCLKHRLIIYCGVTLFMTSNL